MVPTAAYAVALVLALLRLAPRLKDEKEDKAEEDQARRAEAEQASSPQSTDGTYQAIRNEPALLKKGLSFAS